MYRTISVTAAVSRLLLAALLIALVSGCQKTVTTEPEPAESRVENVDIAISVANIINEESGGALDQIGDVLEMISSTPPDALGKPAEDTGPLARTAVYDSLEQLWYIDITREKGTPADTVYGSFSRSYTLQLFTMNGTPQKHWITGGDTARSFDFTIIGGTGEFHRPRIDHHLKSIGGGWIGTGADTEMITLNGTFQRAAVDTIYRLHSTKISDHQISLSLNGVTGPRGSRRDLRQKVSGTITGQFTASVTIHFDNTTVIRNVVREISVDLSSAETRIKVGPQWFSVNAGTGRVSGS